MSEIKKLAQSKISFKVAVPWEKWEKYLDQATQEISAEMKISGFRPGKAPRRLVEQKIGKGMILNKAAEKAVSKSYADFVTENKLEIIGHPEIKMEEVVEKKPLEYQAEVAVVPEAEVKEDYKKEIKKVNEEYKAKKPEVTEEEVKLELDRLANSRVKLVTVNRPAQKNDSVEVDFTVLMDNVPIEGGAAKKHPLIIGRGVFIPGFEENIIGMKENEEKEFELPFPKDYHKKDLAGRPAVFKVKMLLVQERQAPELNDDFAKSMGKFEKLSELKKNLQEGMAHEKGHKMKDEKRTKYMDKIIEKSKAELPEVLVEEELKRMLEEFEYQLQPMGMNLDSYLVKLKKEKKDLEKEWKPQAEKRIMSALALKEIVKQEDIQVDSKAIEAEMNKMLVSYKGIKDAKKNIDMAKLYNYTKGNLENEQAFEMLEKI